MENKLIENVIERHRNAFKEETIGAQFAISVVGDTINTIIETSAKELTKRYVDLGEDIKELIIYVPEDYIMDNMEKLEDWLITDFTMYTDVTLIPKHVSRKDRLVPFEWEPDRYEEDKLITLSGVTYTKSDIKDIGDSRSLKVLKYLADNTEENEFELIELNSSIQAVKLKNDNIVFFDNR